MITIEGGVGYEKFWNYNIKNTNDKNFEAGAQHLRSPPLHRHPRAACFFVSHSGLDLKIAMFTFRSGMRKVDFQVWNVTLNNLLYV